MPLLPFATEAGMPELTGLVGWIADVVAALGSVGVGVAVALEVIVPPIPSEVVLPLAGFLAGRGDLTVVGAIVGSTVGSVVGALGAYWLGAALGPDRVARLWDRIPLSEPDDLDRANAWFADHQQRAVLIGRFIPVVRSVVSIPAGVARMRLAPFVVLTALGSGIWNAVFVVAGYQLGSRWRTVGEYSDVLNWAVTAAIVLGLAWAAARRVARRRREVAS